MTDRQAIPQVGARVPRADARSKVTGREKFASDYYGEDFLWAGVKRSETAHARLTGIDAEAARRLPGVAAVLTHADVTGSNRQGIVHKDEPVLVDDKARRVGDAVALVLAENRETLARALSLIRVDWEELPTVFSPEAALAEGAPLVHEECPGNLLAETVVEAGSGAAGLEGCEAVVSGRFETPRQEHAYLETESGWACVDADGILVITASTQSPFRDRMETAHALGLEMDRVRVIAPYVGGGFGGKDGVTVQCLLGLAALHSGGRPVKMWWSREESFQAGVKRLPARLEYRLGARADGTLQALDCRIVLDAGAYDHLAGEIMDLAVGHAGGAYRIPHVRIEGRTVYTNNPTGGPFRGFGVPQATAAMEQMMDMLAAELGLDPLELRLRNAVRRGDRNPVGVTLTQPTGALECLSRLAEHPLWRNRERWKAEAGPFKVRGAGIACVSQGMGYGPLVPDYANAKIELTADGRFRVDCGVVDMGQGNAATYLQIAGDVLNQPPDRLEAVLPDTGRTLPSGSSSASRTTYTYGNALIGAAEDLRRRIAERASIVFMAPSAEGFALTPGTVRHLPTGREIPLDRLAGMMSPSERVSTFYWRAPMAPDGIRMRSTSVVPGLPHMVISYAAHLALVEVDELTGQATVVHYVSVGDCGRIINPQAYEQQVHGGVVQGLGLALLEDYRVDGGRGTTRNLATYIIPSALDVPQMECSTVALHEPTGPYGMKGAGEISINGPLPATANAVADACDVRVFDGPLSPQRILEALASRGSGCA